MNIIQKKKSIIVLLVTALFFSIGVPGGTATTNPIKWYSYSDAKTLEQKNTQKVFLYFYSTDCYYCGLMERNTFSNSKVAQYINQNFLPIRVNSDTEKNISRSYNVMGNPTNVFLTEKFEIIGNLPGYLAPGDLLNILRYIHTDSFKTMTFDEFLKNANR